MVSVSNVIHPIFFLSLFLVKVDPLRWKSADAHLTGNKDQVCTSALCDLHICFISLKTAHEEFTDTRLLKADDVFLSGLTHHLNTCLLSNTNTQEYSRAKVRQCHFFCLHKVLVLRVQWVSLRWVSVCVSEVIDYIIRHMRLFSGRVYRRVRTRNTGWK